MFPQSSPPHDLVRTVLSVLAIALLLVSTVWILKPFLLALVWAAMIAVASWPLLLQAQKRLHDSRKLAVLAMTAALLLAFIVPLTLAVMTILQNVDVMKDWIKALSAQGLPQPPTWVGNLPLVGEKALETWAHAAAAGPEGLSAQISGYAQTALVWFVSYAGNLGLIVVQCLLCLVLTAILYAKGEVAASAFRKFFFRLSGERGKEMVILAGRAIRAVAMGIVVTALIQSALGGLGLWIAGIPGVGILTALMFLLAISQIGVGPVLLAAVGWLLWKGSTIWAVALLIWGVVVGALDNIVRPILIKKGASLPLLLIMAGVIGGLMAFGVIGLFVGPMVLAVSYTLVNAWINEIGTDEVNPVDHG